MMKWMKYNEWWMNIYEMMKMYNDNEYNIYNMNINDNEWMMKWW